MTPSFRFWPSGGHDFVSGSFFTEDFCHHSEGVYVYLTVTVHIYNEQLGLSKGGWIEVFTLRKF